MAAAALLRSVARKIARAPLPHPRPLPARGFQGGARSGPGCSLPPPTSNEGGRFVVGNAAAAGLRSASRLPSLGTKMAPAPPPHHLHERRLYSSNSANAGGSSGSTPPPTIKDLQLRLSLARAALGVAGIALSGTFIYMYFWLLPELKDHSRRCAIKKKESELIHLLAEDALANVSVGGNQPNIATVKETREEGEVVKAYSAMKGLGAGMKDFEADVKELEAGIKDLQADIQANIAELKIALESARSKGKEKM